MKILPGVVSEIAHAISNKFGRYKDGQEMVDGRPMAVPSSLKAAPSTAELMQQVIRNERVQQQLNDAGYETFEESEDFDVDDDMDPMTPYEDCFEPEDLEELVRRELAGKQLHDELPKPVPSQADRGTGVPPVPGSPEGAAAGGGPKEPPTSKNPA